MYFTVISPNADDAFDIKHWELFNMPPPQRENRCVVLAVDDEKDDRVAGFVVGQTAVHLEPLWIYPDYRHRFILMGMINKLIEAQPGVEVAYTTTDDENVAGILKTLARHLPKRGLQVEPMQRELWRLRRGQLTGK